ncbi:M15 family metallopeptidase [Spirochaetota bacterium]
MFTISKKRRYLILVQILLICLTYNQCLSETNLYGDVKPEDYLTGRFNPYKNKLFVSVSSVGIPATSKRLYLRKDVTLAFKKMLLDFRKSHPKIRIWICSATRNFNVQKSIWEKKFDGRRLVGGKKLTETIKDPLERALRILQYSSMPGTSRHHWGTDLDINYLSNKYYKKGKGKIIYEWLKKNGPKYGFCQPYTDGRDKGYNEERWHWSYRPIAKVFLRDWNKLYKKKVIKTKNKKLFKGAEHSGHLAPIYVNEINKSCK